VTIEGFQGGALIRPPLGSQMVVVVPVWS